MRTRSAAKAVIAAFTLLTLPGCALLVGNIKPVDEKSESYGVMDLAQAKPAEWTRLTAEKIAGDEVSSTEISDVAFQSKVTSAIISLNSACRPAAAQTPNDLEDKRDLKALTNLLFLGMSNVTRRVENGVQIQNLIPALETTIQGKLNGEEMRLRTVVFKKSPCVYDLVYMARPQNFELHEQDFSHFVASLRLR